MGHDLGFRFPLRPVEHVVLRVARDPFVAKLGHQFDGGHDGFLQIREIHFDDPESRWQRGEVADVFKPHVGIARFVIGLQHEGGCQFPLVDGPTDRAVELLLKRIDLVVQSPDAVQLGVCPCAIREDDEGFCHARITILRFHQEGLLSAVVFGNDVVADPAAELFHKSVNDPDPWKLGADKQIVVLDLVHEQLPVLVSRLGIGSFGNCKADGIPIPAFAIFPVDLRIQVSDGVSILTGDDVLLRLGGGDLPGEVELPHAGGTESPVVVVLPECNGDTLPHVFVNQSLSFVGKALGTTPDCPGDLLFNDLLPLSPFFLRAVEGADFHQGLSGVDDAVVGCLRPFELFLGPLEIQVGGVRLIGVPQLVLAVWWLAVEKCL